MARVADEERCEIDESAGVLSPKLALIDALLVLCGPVVLLAVWQALPASTLHEVVWLRAVPVAFLAGVFAAEVVRIVSLTLHLNCDHPHPTADAAPPANHYGGTARGGRDSPPLQLSSPTDATPGDFPRPPNPDGREGGAKVGTDGVTKGRLLAKGGVWTANGEERVRAAEEGTCCGCLPGTLALRRRWAAPLGGVVAALIQAVWCYALLLPPTAITSGPARMVVPPFGVLVGFVGWFLIVPAGVGSIRPLVSGVVLSGLLTFAVAYGLTFDAVVAVVQTRFGIIILCVAYPALILFFRISAMAVTSACGAVRPRCFGTAAMLLLQAAAALPYAVGFAITVDWGVMFMVLGVEGAFKLAQYGAPLLLHSFWRLVRRLRAALPLLPDAIADRLPNDDAGAAEMAVWFAEKALFHVAFDASAALAMLVLSGVAAAYPASPSPPPLMAHAAELVGMYAVRVVYQVLQAGLLVAALAASPARLPCGQGSLAAAWVAVRASVGGVHDFGVALGAGVTATFLVPLLAMWPLPGVGCTASGCPPAANMTSA